MVTLIKKSIPWLDLALQQLAEELHWPRFEKEKVYFSFKNKIWGVDLADIQLTSKLD